MRVYNRIWVLLGLTGLLLSGCGDEETAPSSQEKQLSDISNTWVVTSVTLDGGDVTEDYSSFELTLSGTANSTAFTFGVVGRPLLSPWPESGTWIFGSDVMVDIVRDPGTADQLQMDYSITGDQLVIEFMFNGTGYDAPARVSSAAGEWVYTFSRQ